MATICDVCLTPGEPNKNPVRPVNLILDIADRSPGEPQVGTPVGVGVPGLDLCRSCFVEAKVLAKPMFDGLIEALKAARVPAPPIDTGSLKKPSGRKKRDS